MRAHRTNFCHDTIHFFYWLPPNNAKDYGSCASSEYSEFKEQLTRSSDGRYETALPWKGDHPPLPNNQNGSLLRLNSLLRKLRRTDMLAQYDAVIREQLEEGVVERAPSEAMGREFYLPHRTVVREKAETKLRVVYDASAHAHNEAPSLNDCLHAGPPLQNQLWSVLTRNRFHSVAVTGDIRKAFLQIKIRQAERDSLRFHWIKDVHSSEVEILRFTRVVFGLAPSPFLLNGVIQQHLELWRTRLPESVSEALKSLYVDDFISGAPTVTDAKKLKSETAEVFADAKFELHKWHSNVPDLETTAGDDEPTFAKQQLETKLNRGKSKLLGLPWDKVLDTLSVVFPAEAAELTKRAVLANLAKLYDTLGLVDVYANRWKNWEHKLLHSVTLPRSLATHQEPIKEIKLHAFGDASGNGVNTAIYVVVTQESGVTQGLVAAKSRLAKQGLTIPRLELISRHMAVNLVTNVHKALAGFPLATEIQCWLDSTVALHWLRDQGEYRQFVTNRVRKIQSHPNTQWRDVPSTENPADLGSRGGSVTDVQLSWRGPQWLTDLTSWPEDIVTQASQQSDAERKVRREIFAADIKISDDLDHVLEKFDLHKALRVCAWVLRFIRNSQRPSEQIQGPLSTQEIIACDQ